MKRLVKVGGGVVATFASRTPARIPAEYEVREGEVVVGFVWSARDVRFPKANVIAWFVKLDGAEARRFEWFADAKAYALAGRGAK